MSQPSQAQYGRPSTQGPYGGYSGVGGRQSYPPLQDSHDPQRYYTPVPSQGEN